MSAASATDAAAAAAREKEEKGWRAAWLRGGSTTEVTWIGRDVLAWCSGLHVVFLDVPTNRLRLPAWPNDSIASGVSCLAGHLRHKVFAIAEKNVKPRIQVFTYPSMTKISTCQKGTSYVYLSMAFAGDYLVSLGSMFGFRLSVWSWRTGEKLTSVHTHIHDAEEYGQILRVNYVKPLSIAQIGNESGKLSIWETTLCGSAAFFNNYDVLLPKKALVKDVAWCPESNDVLAVVDRDGHIYLCDSRGDNLKRIVLSQRCAVCVDYEPPSICWYRGGIVLRTTFCQIRYYRRDDKTDHWRKAWQNKFESHPRALTSHPSRNDRVFLLTSEGHVMRMNFADDPKEPPAIEERHFIGGRYRFVDFVRPWDDHVAAMDDSSELAIVRADVGLEVSKVSIDLGGRPTSMHSHPDYPLVAICSESGEIAFVSIVDVLKPKVLGRYWMQMAALDLIEFSNSGRFLAACQKKTGSCYFFNVSCAKAIEVVTRLNLAFKIADAMLFDTAKGLKFCALRATQADSKLGHELSLYLLPTGATEFNDTPPRIFRLPCFYGRLYPVPGDSMAFVGTPHLTKKLTYFRTTNDGKSLSLYEVGFTGHYARRAEVFVNKKWLITTGFDGLVCVKNLTAKRSQSSRLFTHHRNDSGVARAAIGYAGDVVVALGSDGTLVGMRYGFAASEAGCEKFCEFGRVLVEGEGEGRKKKGLDAKVAEALSRSIRAFCDSGSVPWTGWREQQKMEKETKLYAGKRKAIESDFAALREKVVELLNENEDYSEPRRLPISAFALDKLFRERKIKAAKDEREETRHQLESDELEKNRVARWIREKFWKSQSVLACSIFGIFDGEDENNGDTEVTNYAMPKQSNNVDTELCFEYSKFERSVTTELTDEDHLYPWRTYTEAEIKTEIVKRSSMKETNPSQTIDRILEDEEEGGEQAEQTDEFELCKELYEGMTTKRFVEPCAPYYSQFKVYAFSQFLCDNRNVLKDTMALRRYFNERFAELRSIKEREINLVRDRVDRVLFIISELETMFDERIETDLRHPEWRAKERPESIVVVSDRELRARPYVSPSYQEILDKQAAEEERARLARLADDFRERALRSMMDGVLEVRWEDIIKRDPEKPECLVIGKSTEDYTDEDHLAVKKYEQELNHLTAEREKYRKILQSEYTKTSEALEESVKKFGSRLQEFHLLKIKVESAIQQLNLRYARRYAKHLRRLEELKEEESARSGIQAKREEIATIEEKTRVIGEAERELQAHHESLLSKDKFMEKKLTQSEFTGLTKNALGALMLQFKRRPRVGLKNTSAEEGADLGDTVVSMVKIPYLTSESLDYLRQLDNLDVRPASLPQSVEASHWESLVALRRLKIEHELKLRATSMNLEAVANALSTLTRKQEDLRASIDSTNEQLKLSRVKRAQSDLNAELQLILKMGQVEDEPLRGSLGEDLRQAILVPRSELEVVNRVLASKGGKKVRAIARNLTFNRGIELEAWEHRCLMTKIEHREVMLYYVRMANVTRETREYLKRKRTGELDDKAPHKLHRQVDRKRLNLEKSVKEWEAKLNNAREEVLRLEQKNKKLDEKIVSMNVERCEMELERDYESEVRQREFRDMVVKIFAERSAIVRRLKGNFEQMSMMREQLKNSICKNG